MKGKTAKEIAQLYSERWAIEVFIRTCKQRFGLKDCLSRSLLNQEAHCLLALRAYNFLVCEQLRLLKPSLSELPSDSLVQHLKKSRLPHPIQRLDRIFYAIA